MRRRQFLSLLGSAAVVWPLAARAQQPAMPVIGFLSSRFANDSAPLVAAFRQGLGETGYVEGRNVAIEYRWAENKYDRLQALADDLVRRQIAVIVAITTPSALAAKAVTATIPIVFELAGDPIEVRLVTSLNRPGGNATGVTQLSVEVVAKQLELLHQLVPVATLIAALVNPKNALAEPTTRHLQAAARALGLQLHILHASTERDIATAFASLVQLRAGGLVIGPDALFSSRSDQLAALSIRHAVPAIYSFREFVAAGGLMSYAGNLADAYRLAGVYSGKILNGEKPADLPVQQSTKIEFILNLKTAKALGLNVPLELQVAADEVIE